MFRQILILTLASTLATASPNGGDLLWYDKPAQNWNAALPIGKWGQLQE
jgi:hypothetical protein